MLCERAGCEDFRAAQKFSFQFMLWRASIHWRRAEYGATLRASAPLFAPPFRR
jgi:hypothetical protein